MSNQRVGRSFDELQDKIKSFNRELRETQPELRAIDRGLKLDPGNVDLVNQRFGVFANQLEINRNRADALQQQMARLTGELSSGKISQELYAKQMSTLERQARVTRVEITTLEGALARKNETIARAKFGGITQGMQAASQAAQQMSMMMSSLTAVTGLMGATADSSGDKTMQGMMRAMSGMQAVIGLSTMLQQTNTASTSSFQKLAVSATLAMGAFALVNGLLQGMTGTMRTVVGGLAVLTAAIGAAATAWAVKKGVMTLGAAVPAMLAAAGVAAAGIRALIPSAGESSASVDSGGSIANLANVSVPSARGPSGTSSVTHITNNNASRADMEEASFRGFMRAINASGLANKQFVGIVEMNGRETAQIIFGDFLEENQRLGSPILTR